MDHLLLRRNESRLGGTWSVLWIFLSVLHLDCNLKKAWPMKQGFFVKTQFLIE